MGLSVGEQGGGRIALFYTHAKLLLVSLYIPAVEEKWCERIPSVQPSVLPPSDTRVASQESQVISQSHGKCLLADGQPAREQSFPAILACKSHFPLELGQSKPLS